MTKLNLDSDGAFRTAENEASRNQVGFDSVNYRLSVDGASGQPVWTLEMFDYEQRPVGTVRIAAGNGTLLSAGNWVPEGRDARGQQERQNSDSEALAGPPPPPNGDVNPPADYRQPGTIGVLRRAILTHTAEKPLVNAPTDMVLRSSSSVKTVVHKTTRAFQTVGGWFQEKFTGHNTIDPKHGQEDDR